MQNKVCVINGCDKKVHAKNHCSLHYQRLIFGRDMLKPVMAQRPNGDTKRRDASGNKQCLNCENWYPESYFKKHHSTADRLDVRCKECETFQRTKRQYGIDEDSIRNKIKEQGGCAICGFNDKLFPVWWTVDHDHSCCSGNTSCGKCIRGILCAHCNRGLGQFKDSKTILHEAIKYLEKSKR